MKLFDYFIEISSLLRSATYISGKNRDKSLLLPITSSFITSSSLYPSLPCHQLLIKWSYVHIFYKQELDHCSKLPRGHCCYFPENVLGLGSARAKWTEFIWAEIFGAWKWKDLKFRPIWHLHERSHVASTATLVTLLNPLLWSCMIINLNKRSDYVSAGWLIADLYW